MGTLRYPSKFEAGMPVITFIPFRFKAPLPGLSILDSAFSRDSGRADTVGLYAPGDISENVVCDWGPENVYQEGGTVLGALASNATNFLNERGLTKEVASVQAAGHGHAPFPLDINIFKGVQPMSLSLNFTMIPYNKTEGDDIIKICQNFKKAQIPQGDLTTKNVLLDFPDVWDIHFSKMNGPGLVIPQIYENMCLISVNVQYVSGTEGASTYHDYNPTQIKLSLAFTALRKHFIAS